MAINAAGCTCSQCCCHPNICVIVIYSIYVCSICYSYKVLRAGNISCFGSKHTCIRKQGINIKARHTSCINGNWNIRRLQRFFIQEIVSFNPFKISARYKCSQIAVTFKTSIVTAGYICCFAYIGYVSSSYRCIRVSCNIKHSIVKIIIAA